MRSLAFVISRWIYALSASVFLAGVVIQVFLAGLALVARRSVWDTHRSLGHSLVLVLILMLLTMTLAKIPVGDRWLSVLLFGIYFIQADVVLFLRNSVPYAAALHPVLALLDFLLALHLARISFGNIIKDFRQTPINWLRTRYIKVSNNLIREM